MNVRIAREFFILSGKVDRYLYLGNYSSGNNMCCGYVVFSEIRNPLTYQESTSVRLFLENYAKRPVK